MHQKLLKLVRDKAFKCNKVNCDIKADVDSLKVFADQIKDYDYCRNVFIYYPMVFNSLHRLQLEGEEGLKNLILRLKKHSIESKLFV